jgi:cytochrome c-type biogenesis protein CcmE
VTRKGRRLVVIGTAGAVLAGALGLALNAMRDTIVFFRAPSEVAAATVPPGKRFRLGGLVDANSVKRGPDQTVEFSVGDGASSVPVRYRGLLPDLFREGQGVVTEGTLSTSGVFVADTVLARHDESYMPREVADALKSQGRWKGSEAAAPAQLRQATQ